MKSSLHLGIALIILTVSAAGYALSFLMVGKASVEAATLRADILTKQETTERISAVHEALAELGSDEQMIDNYFVSEENVVSFLGDLQSLGEGLGTAVEVLSVSTGKNKGNPSLIVGLRVEGKFESVLRTVGAFEYAPYEITVQNAAVTRNNDSTETVEWNASLTIAVGVLATSTLHQGLTPNPAPATSRSAPIRPVLSPPAPL